MLSSSLVFTELMGAAAQPAYHHSSQMRSQCFFPARLHCSSPALQFLTWSGQRGMEGCSQDHPSSLSCFAQVWHTSSLSSSVLIRTSRRFGKGNPCLKGSSDVIPVTSADEPDSLVGIAGLCSGHSMSH